MRKFLSHPAVLAAIVFVACSTKADENIDHVQRVFMHDTDEYTFMVQNPDTGTMRMEKRHANSVTLVRDVPPDKEMWAKYVNTGGCGEDGTGINGTLTIHLHFSTEVEGAGWDRGKSGNGTTQPIE